MGTEIVVNSLMHAMFTVPVIHRLLLQRTTGNNQIECTLQ